MKELTRSYSDLLRDKRVRTEQNRYEAFSRQRNSVMTKYRRASQAFRDLHAGLERAQGFYSEMKQTVGSLSQNVDSFVSNRKAEGGELLSQIERSRRSESSSGANREHERLTELMDRMKMPSGTPSQSQASHRPPPLQNVPQYQTFQNPTSSPPVSNTAYPKPGPHQNLHSPPAFPRYPRQQSGQPNGSYNQFIPSTQGYNPNSYGPVSPPPGQQTAMGSPGVPYSGPTSPPANQQFNTQQAQQPQSIPAGYRPPPPPPGPPPQGQGSSDPWAGLSGWK